LEAASRWANTAGREWQRRQGRNRSSVLPDLDHSKTAVLDSLRSPESKRGYRHAIDEFIQWYCSEPRLSFNKIVVTRFRIALENRGLAAGTINGRLAAVRRLAYEAADAGLLGPELAAGIRRVKGVKKLGVRLGSWLTADEAPHAGDQRAKPEFVTHGGSKLCNWLWRYQKVAPTWLENALPADVRHSL